MRQRLGHSHGGHGYRRRPETTTRASLVARLPSKRQLIDQWLKYSRCVDVLRERNEARCIGTEDIDAQKHFDRTEGSNGEVFDDFLTNIVDFVRCLSNGKNVVNVNRNNDKCRGRP